MSLQHDHDRKSAKREIKEVKDVSGHDGLKIVADPVSTTKPKPKFKIFDWRLGLSGFAGMTIFEIILLIKNGSPELPEFWLIPASVLTWIIYSAWNKASPQK